MQHWFWYSLFHCCWPRYGGSGRPVNPDKYIQRWKASLCQQGAW